MRGLRQNLADTILGIAVVLTIGGVVATIATRGAIFDVFRRNLAPTSASVQPATAERPPPEAPPVETTDAGRAATDPVATRLEGRFGVSLGTFRDGAAAAELAKTFIAAGYPVVIAARDEASIVLAGTYEDVAEAERIADQIRAADGGTIDPTIYVFSENIPVVERIVIERVVVERGVTAPAPAAEATPAETAPPDPAATLPRGRYLQVGAYNSVAGLANPG